MTGTGTFVEGSEGNQIFAYWDSFVKRMEPEDILGLREISGGELDSEEYTILLFSNQAISIEQAQEIMLKCDPEEGSHNSGIGSYRNQLFKDGDTIVREIYLPKGYKMPSIG